MNEKYYSIFDGTAFPAGERRRRRLAVLFLCVGISWVLWCVVSVPYYRTLPVSALWREIPWNLFEHLVETILLAGASLYLNRLVLRAFWRRSKSFYSLMLLVVLVFSVCILLSLGVALFYQAVYPAKEDIFWRAFYTDSAMTSVLSAAVMISFMVSRHEEEHLAHETAVAQVHAAELVQLQSKLDKLALQADNHFVFNTLNVLYNLISVRPDDARDFTLKLARIYRYLLSCDARKIISVGQEIAFTKDYLSLIDYRYPGVRYQVDPQLDSCEGFLPPVSVQMMVENVLKHNRHGEKEDLRIHVYLQDDYIVVENNILPRLDTPEESGHGIQNLSSRSELLCGKKVKVENNGACFRVFIPLISLKDVDADYEGIHH